MWAGSVYDEPDRRRYPISAIASAGARFFKNFSAECSRKEPPIVERSEAHRGGTGGSEAEANEG